jgi:DNA-binding GntR family transcriptional regulator
VACRAALLRLERDGAVERVPVEGFRHTFWRATDTDMLASMLDEMGMAE